MENRLYKFSEVKKLEDEALKQRRQKLGEVSSDQLDMNRFGLALSGGGIRSAVINLGFLKTLNLFNILKKADYLSTVSGGGYTGAYIQATLKNEGSYEKLFQDEHIEYMRSRGEYMIPGSGFWKLWNQFVLVISFLVSLVMSWMSPLIVLLLFYGVYLIIGGAPFDADWYDSNVDLVYQYGVPFLCGLFGLHFLSNIFLNYNLDISHHFNRLETGVGMLAVLAFLGILIFSFNDIAVRIVWSYPLPTRIFN